MKSKLTKAVGRKKLTLRPVFKIKQRIARPMTDKHTRSADGKCLENDYSKFFAPKVSPEWSRDEDEKFLLEQPSNLKFVPTETTYGVGGVFTPSTIA